MSQNTRQPVLDAATVTDRLMSAPEKRMRIRHEFEVGWWVLGLFDPESAGSESERRWHHYLDPEAGGPDAALHNALSRLFHGLDEVYDQRPVREGYTVCIDPDWQDGRIAGFEVTVLDYSAKAENLLEAISGAMRSASAR